MLGETNEKDSLTPDEIKILLWLNQRYHLNFGIFSFNGRLKHVRQTYRVTTKGLAAKSFLLTPRKNGLLYFKL